ncbi:hypothetical protein GCM10020367_49800 [Streptomyces sannanensis]|uniref:Uncharacterized protein n=1 Tax=Streptomyces sannanensis TaxID=285536 RepID=A0ABP6SHW5_9ACTN
MVPVVDVVDRPGGFHVQGGVDLRLDLGGRERGDEVDFRVQQRGDVRIGHQLGVRDEQEVLAVGDLPQGLHRADDLGDLPGAAVVDAMKDRDPAVAGDGEPGLDLLQIHPPVLGVTVLDLREPVLLVLERAEERHRGHVPVDLADVDAELRDGLGTDRAGDLVQVRGDRVQGAGEPVVVQQLGIDTEDLLHRPLPRPVLHPDHGRRRGQPVGDQDFNHLPVGQVRDLADRAQRVDDPGHIQPAQKLGRGGQSAQTPLHHGSELHRHPRTVDP